jgi:16S rRNA A1518/A1519 N6-dimethyltransferase RsmA/KsgA/DIM1 with predicted DNA glycosylase/AP lyase activity
MSDPDDDIRERVVETVAMEPDAIIIQIIDENIEDEIELSIIEGNATQINYDSTDPNTPQAIVVAIVIPPR